VAVFDGDGVGVGDGDGDEGDVLPMLALSEDELPHAEQAKASTTAST